MERHLPNTAEEFFSSPASDEALPYQKSGGYRVSVHGNHTPIEERPVWEFIACMSGIFGRLLSLLKGLFMALIPGAGAFGMAGNNEGGLAVTQQGSPDQPLFELTPIGGDVGNIRTSLESKTKFDFMKGRYDGLFKEEDKVYVFTTTPGDTQAATANMTENTKSSYMNVIDNIEYSNVAGSMVVLEDRNTGKKSTIIITGDEVDTKKGLHTADHEAYHAWEAHNPAYKAEHFHPEYMTYLEECSAEAFATLMRTKYSGLDDGGEIVSQMEGYAANLFDIDVPLKDAVEHYSASTYRAALDVPQDDLTSLSATEVAIKAASLRDDHALPFNEYLALKEYVAHIRDVTTGADSHHLFSPNDPLFEKWNDHFSAHLLPFENAYVSSAAQTIKHYKQMYQNERPGEVVNLQQWQDRSDSLEREYGTAQKTTSSPAPRGS